MDETEFRRLLDLFPVVRTRDYQAELDSSRQLTSLSAQDEVNEWQDAWNEEDKKQMESQDAFWQKLKLAAGRKVSETDAEKFCQVFQQFHNKLVYEGLSLEAARSFINTSKSSEE